MTDLRELEKRLEALEACSEQIDAKTAEAIDRAFPFETEPDARYELISAVRGSLDAAVALVERVLPGWSIELRTEDHHENGWRAAMWCSWGPVAYGRCDAREKALPTLALCLALVRALIAKG